MRGKTESLLRTRSGRGSPNPRTRVGVGRGGPPGPRPRLTEVSGPSVSRPAAPPVARSRIPVSPSPTDPMLSLHGRRSNHRSQARGRAAGKPGGSLRGNGNGVCVGGCRLGSSHRDQRRVRAWLPGLRGRGAGLRAEGAGMGLALLEGRWGAGRGGHRPGVAGGVPGRGSARRQHTWALPSFLPPPPAPLSLKTHPRNRRRKNLERNRLEVAFPSRANRQLRLPGFVESSRGG